MLKFAGGIIVILSMGLFGNFMYREMEKKLKLTEDLKNGFSYIKSDISLASYVLSDVLKRGLEFAGEGKFIFENCSFFMINDNKNFENAWELSLKDIKDVRLLEILSEVGKRLGKNTAEEEVAFLESISKKLDAYSDFQRKKLSSEGKILKKAGFILGIATVILLF